MFKYLKYSLFCLLGSSLSGMDQKQSLTSEVKKIPVIDKNTLCVISEGQGHHGHEKRIIYLQFDENQEILSPQPDESLVTKSEKIRTRGGYTFSMEDIKDFIGNNLSWCTGENYKSFENSFYAYRISSSDICFKEKDGYIKISDHKYEKDLQEKECHTFTNEEYKHIKLEEQMNRPVNDILNELIINVHKTSKHDNDYRYKFYTLYRINYINFLKNKYNNNPQKLDLINKLTDHDIQIPEYYNQ